MRVPTPFGPAWIETNEQGAVTKFSIGGEPSRDNSKNPDIAEQLSDYFAGRRRSFDFPLAPEGTEFQKRVWAELVKIPFGETISYGTLAKRLGMPTASRAVGSANGANPIWLIVPCHRVIGANGKLTGYAGGIDLKRRLLDWERGQLRVDG